LPSGRPRRWQACRCAHVEPHPAEAKPQWEERIRTAEAKGMEPLVEPTLGRWFTAPFRERRKDVVDQVAAMIRATPVAGYAGCCHAIAALD
jgi:3-oxoadipate enol-lactonase